MTADDRRRPGAPPRFEPALMRRKLTGTLFYGACLLAVAILLLALIALLLGRPRRGLPWLDVEFLTGMPSRRPAQAGILPALVGSIELGIIVGADHLPDRHRRRPSTSPSTRRDNRLNRLLQTNISNLAGVPSIIYGILGLAIFVRLLGLGRSVLAAALTLTLLILPVVIIASSRR